MPLISIVIATRNRIPYAICAIKTILNIPESCMELVVQDNSDTRELANYVVDNIHDSRFVYNYTPPPFSSIDNFNKAIDLSNGEYICLIGDDDGVNPEIIEAARWARDNDIDALNPSVIAQYLWPGVMHKSLVGTKTGGTFTIDHFCRKVTYAKVNEELSKLVRNGGQDYLELNLPKLYHGIVKRKCMQKIASLTGDYLGGLSPDIYAVVALANVSRRVVCIDYPLTIPGACNASTSIDAIKGKHSGRSLENTVHFRDRDSYEWHDQVPRLFSVETIWADSAIAALEDFNRKDLIAKFNLTMLHAYCLFVNPQLYDITIKNLVRISKKNGINKFWTAIGLVSCLLSGPCRKLLKQVIRKIESKINPIRRTKLYGIDDIAEATQALSNYIAKHGYSFKETMKANHIS